MSLSNITLPGAISAARDPVWVELLCGGYRTSAPVAAVYELTLVEDPTAGMTWSLDLPSGLVAFEFVSGTPDDSGNQIRIGADSAETSVNMADALQANYYVDQLFSVSESGGVITLVAREAQAMSIAITNTSPVTLAWNENTAGSDGVFAEYYTANLQVWVERTWGSGTFVPLPVIDGRPDENRRVRWDIRELLKAELGYDWPAYDLNTMLVTRALQRKFYLTYFEQYGDPVVPKKVTRLPERKAWYAGSRNAEHNVIAEVWGLLAATGEDTPFLTYLGRNGMREVSPTQYVWLSWQRNRAKVADQQFTLKAVITYTDGSTSSAQTLWTDTNGSGWQLGDVALWNVGFRKNGLHLVDATKTPDYYTVTVHDSTGAAISEAYDLHVRHTETNEAHLEWVNSLGVVESTRCKGSWVLGMATEHEAVKRWRAVVGGTLPTVQESNRRSLLVGGQQRLQLSTGFMDARELNALADLLLSPEWRWVDHDRASRHPLHLVDAEHVIGQAGTDTEHLHALNLEFEVGDTELAWSDRLGMPESPGELPSPDLEDA